MPTRVISLGGVNDVTQLVGWSYTYVASAPGALAQCLSDLGTASPLIVFDELDKLSDTLRAHEVAALLMALVDPATNARVVDRYFSGLVPLDFSRCSFVFTLNDRARVRGRGRRERKGKRAADAGGRDDATKEEEAARAADDVHFGGGARDPARPMS